MRDHLFAAATFAALLTAFGALSGSFSAASADETSMLSERQLLRLFPGEFQVVAHGFLKLHITASTDGKLSAQQVGKSDTGRWEIRADRLCIKFSKWLKGRTRCSRVRENAGWYSTTDVVFKKSGDVVLGTAE
jgi:hypothetical protein